MAALPHAQSLLPPSLSKKSRNLWDRLDAVEREVSASSPKSANSASSPETMTPNWLPMGSQQYVTMAEAQTRIAAKQSIDDYELVMGLKTLSKRAGELERIRSPPRAKTSISPSSSKVDWHVDVSKPDVDVTKGISYVNTHPTEKGYHTSPLQLLEHKSTDGWVVKMSLSPPRQSSPPHQRCDKPARAVPYSTLLPGSSTSLHQEELAFDAPTPKPSLISYGSVPKAARDLTATEEKQAMKNKMQQRLGQTVEAASKPTTQTPLLERPEPGARRRFTLDDESPARPRTDLARFDVARMATKEDQTKQKEMIEAAKAEAAAKTAKAEEARANTLAAIQASREMHAELERAKAKALKETVESTTVPDEQKSVRFDVEVAHEEAAKKAEIAMKGEQYALFAEARAEAEAKKAQKKWAQLKVNPGVADKVGKEQQAAIQAARKKAAEAKEKADKRLSIAHQNVKARHADVEDATAVLTATQKALEEKKMAESEVKEVEKVAEMERQRLVSAERALEAMPHYAEDREHGVVITALQTVLVGKVDTWAKVRASHFLNQKRKAELAEARAQVDLLPEGEAKDKACEALFKEEVTNTRQYNESAKALQTATEEKDVAAMSIDSDQIAMVIESDPLAGHTGDLIEEILGSLQSGVCTAMRIGTVSGEADTGPTLATEELNCDTRAALHEKCLQLAALSAEERAESLAGMPSKERILMLSAYAAHEGIATEVTDSGARETTESDDWRTSMPTEVQNALAVAPTSPAVMEVPSTPTVVDDDDLYQSSADLYAQMAREEAQAVESEAKSAETHQAAEEPSTEVAPAEQHQSESTIEAAPSEEVANASVTEVHLTEDTPQGDTKQDHPIVTDLKEKLVEKEEALTALQETHAENEDRKEHLEQTKQMIGTLLPDRPIESAAAGMQDDIQAAEAAVKISKKQLEKAREEKETIEERLDMLSEKGVTTEQTLAKVQIDVMPWAKEGASALADLAEKIKIANSDLAALQAELLGAKRGSNERKTLQTKSDEMEASVAAMRAELGV